MRYTLLAVCFSLEVGSGGGGGGEEGGEEGGHQFEMALDQDPHFAMAHTNLGAVIMTRIGAGELPPSIELHDQVARSFETAIDLDPSLVEPYRGLAKLQLAVGDPGSAVSTLEAAFQVVGADSAVRELLSTAYQQTGKSPKSKEILAFLRQTENGK